jgi:hypothetical protein
MTDKAQISSNPKLRALADKFCNLWKTEKAHENFVQSNRNLPTSLKLLSDHREDMNITGHVT